MFVEDLARIRVNEAIQTGLQAQYIRRGLGRQNGSPEAVPAVTAESATPHRFIIALSKLFSWRSLPALSRESREAPC
jgi:hypothetical protein